MVSEVLRLGQSESGICDAPVSPPVLGSNLPGAALAGGGGHAPLDIGSNERASIGNRVNEATDNE